VSELPWYEVWADEGISPPYVLLLCGNMGPVLEVYDPTERRVVYRASTYEEVRNWLLEDEYTQVQGRMCIE
jgi:hypothetical protein